MHGVCGGQCGCVDMGGYVSVWICDWLEGVSVYLWGF